MKRNIVKIIGILVITLFLSLIIMNYTGFLEYQNRKQVRITEESIDKFEKDIKDGRDIDIKNYIKKEKNNSNRISIITYKISKGLGNIVNKMVVMVFKSIENSMDE